MTRLVDPLGPLASASPLRSAVQPKPLLHAVVSCRWTLRSDRAQQAKAEAQQLIRNRRGRAPHLVMVTGEPMPSRLAAVALGTGELDCVYHFALHELMDAIDPAGGSGRCGADAHDGAGPPAARHLGPPPGSGDLSARRRPRRR
ncbi:hypothetical protein A5N15_07985 [Rothia kristinae]|uniref:Uncharacterized protein n=1 Tax=Rothia kristinae TaxID=37923 RepID=A0A657IU81_9MICC|nr:hypothetical protein A5N15_07985 [Rothia kristinae]